MAGFLISTPDSRNIDSERIFSSEAQEKALIFKGIKDHREANWDIFPMALYYEKISSLTQDEIDMEGLGAIGCYRN